MVHSLAIFINGENFPNPNARGEPVTDDSFYMIFNAHFEDLDFILPPNRWGMRWLNSVRYCGRMVGGWGRARSRRYAVGSAAVVRAAAAAGLINLRTFAQFLRHPEA